MAKRKSISAKSRFDIFKRDKYTCVYCGATPPDVVLHIDHVTPVCLGGDNAQTNLVTACSSCNQGKSGTPLNTAPKSLDDQMAEQIEKRKQIEERNKYLMSIREREDEDIAEVGRYWHNLYKDEIDGWVFGTARKPAVRLFLTILSKVDVLEAMDLAHSKVPVRYDRDDQTYKYFCGICWNKIKAKKHE